MIQRINDFFIKCFFLIALPLTSFGQSQIKLENTKDLEDIGLHTFYLEDASLDLTIEEVIGEEYKSQFVSNTQKNINFSSTASAYWIRFEIINTLSEEFYLNIGSAYIDTISLYELNESNQVLSTRNTGDNLPFDSREIEVGNYLFKLNQDQNEKRTYYLRVKSDQPLFFTLRTGTLANFAGYEHDLDFLQGMYFGFMLLIFLYNLFLYFSTREKIYLYYIAYVFSITWFMASIFGYFFEYLWPSTPYINEIVVITSGLTMITATLFTQKFLNTKESGSRSHKISYVFLITGVIVCLLVVSNFKIEGLKLAQGGLLLMALYFVFLGVRFRIKGFRPATFYLFAWGALIVGICMAILESLNVLPVMSYLNAMQIGSALEVLLLSFALGYRINLYKKEKEEAQNVALTAAKENERLITEQNIILETKVQERTKEVAQRNDDLLLLNKEKDVLVNMVAHDLRTPLAQIKLLIQLIDIPTLKLKDEEKGYLTEIDNSTGRLLQMIRSILNTHTLQTKELKINIEALDLSEIGTYVTKSFQQIATEKDISLTMEASETPCLSQVDRNFFIQVLENLISNAIKFSNRGSKVVLKIKNTDKQNLVIVEDFGPGISEEDQKKLFGRYQRLSAQPTEDETSIGLGLSIVKKYIEAMNGKIHCESTLGKGTQFIITLDSIKE